MKMEIVLENGRKENFEVSQFPAEGKLFEVNPFGIDWSKFEEPRSDRRQEWTRKTILEAFDEVNKNPEKYSSFYTLILEKKGHSSKIILEFEKDVKDIGGIIADWIDQSMEWAQRIFNGESWEDVCNKADNAEWKRIILWKNGYYRDVGGSRHTRHDIPASYVNNFEYDSNERNYYGVPLVRINKK